MIIRKAELKDAPLLSETRKLQLIDEGIAPDCDIDKELDAFFNKWLVSKDFLQLIAEEDGKLLTLCSACHNVIKRTNEDIKTDDNLRLKANNYLNLDTPYLGETDVIHYLELLRDYVGFDKIKEKVVNPLKGKKIAAYYGCLLLR